MPWMEILTLIATLVKDCFASGRKEADVKAQIKNPGPLAKMRFETAVRKKKGLSLKEWRDQSAAVMGPIYADCANCTDADLTEIMTQAKEVDWDWS